MIINTKCPSCDKNIRADVRHKEAVVAPTPAPAKLVCIIQCEYCRAQANLYITITPREEQPHG